MILDASCPGFDGDYGRTFLFPAVLPMAAAGAAARAVGDGAARAPRALSPTTTRGASHLKFRGRTAIWRSERSVAFTVTGAGQRRAVLQQTGSEIVFVLCLLIWVVYSIWCPCEFFWWWVNSEKLILMSCSFPGLAQKSIKQMFKISDSTQTDWRVSVWYLLLSVELLCGYLIFDPIIWYYLIAHGV